jgi:TPR repeat protein
VIELSFDFEGVPQSNEEAMKYFHLASDNGFQSAHLKLGFIYKIGSLGVAQDLVLALKYACLSVCLFVS